jgi:hypothetical protein
MGTLQHPLLTLHIAYPLHTAPSHNPPATVVLAPVTLSIKRTLGSAARPIDHVKTELFRTTLLREWRVLLRPMETNDQSTLESLLTGMMRSLRRWESSGRELDVEYAEMAADIKSLWDRGRVIQRPQKALVKDRSSWSTATSSSQTSRSQKSRDEIPVRYQRRESEKFVTEALDRGEPVTLFSNTPPKSPSKKSPSKKAPSEHGMRAAAGVAGRRDFGRDRDVTPTPADPYSLRHDPLTPHTPRKRAALYDSPRWPTGGRPSPDTPVSSRHRQTREVRRRGMDVERDAIPLDLGVPGKEVVAEEDPAERIWKGIDEEYTSGGGGGIMSKRWGRRKGSLRPSGAESMMSAPSLYHA